MFWFQDTGQSVVLNSLKNIWNITCNNLTRGQTMRSKSGCALFERVSVYATAR